jgi:sugar lactone lactonase YvrE
MLWLVGYARSLAVLGLLLGAPGEEVTAQALEVVAELQEAPGNVAVLPGGRIVMSLHQFYEPEYRVVELHADGSTTPFPNEWWATPPDASGIGLQAVLGLRADARGRVWLLDNGASVPRLVVWGTRGDRLERFLPIPWPATRAGSFHNDLAVDLLNDAVYIADIGGDEGPALVVVDLETGFSRRVLAGHPSVQAEDVPLVIDGREVTLTGADGTSPARVGVNPITIDPSFTWVYWGAMHGTSLWRAKAADLADLGLPSDELAARVERYGDKPVSDGISIDVAGNVYVTDLAAGAIGVTGPDGAYRVLYEDERLSWPDGISAGPDGWMYVTVNQLHRSAPLNGGTDASIPPYYLMRFRPLAAAVVGR